MQHVAHRASDEVANPDQKEQLINKRVAQYVKLRDHIKELDDAHKEKMKPYRQMLEELNASLLNHLNSIGAEAVCTDAGTVYSTAKKSASIADGDVFMKYVIEHQAWDLLDRKANVSAVADHIEEFHAAPPGVNYSVTYVAGVRRK
jgi:hypothetical protein